MKKFTDPILTEDQVKILLEDIDDEFNCETSIRTDRYNANEDILTIEIYLQETEVSIYMASKFLSYAVSFLNRIESIHSISKDKIDYGYDVYQDSTDVNGEPYYSNVTIQIKIPRAL